MERDEIAFLLNTAVKAGRAIMEVYTRDDHGVEIKADDSPLTQADLVSNKVIIEALKSTGLPILSEEGRDIPYEERKHWERFWLVDPLDGTKEFIKRNGEFTVNIALIEENEPAFGVIYAPEPDLLYFGGKDVPSVRIDGIAHKEIIAEEDIRNGKVLPLFHNDKNTYRIVASRSHRNQETENFIVEMKEKHELEFVAKGSSLKFCVVAEGAADCYPRFAPTMEWDTAAGHAICEGVKCKFKPTPSLHYNKQDLKNPSFVIYSTNWE